MDERSILSARPTMEGAGVRLHRVFGYDNIPRFDPFLMLDDFSSNTASDFIAGFPWHPHRGIETVTYLLDGAVRHADSMGTKGVIGAGDVQWMTAGSGIIHEEMPERANGRIAGFQLWVNLPRKHKMISPRYRGIEAASIPVVNENGSQVRVIAGTYGTVKGPVQELMVSINYFDVTLAAKSDFSFDMPGKHAGFIYVFEGAAAVGGMTISRRQAAPVSGSLTIHSDAGGRFLLVSGTPLNEPIAWGGPIVMNTEDELRIAFDEYENGTFIRN